MSRLPDVTFPEEPATQPEQPTPARVLRLVLACVAWLNQRRIVWALVWVMAAIFVGLVGYHALYRHWEYHTDAFDLGNMDQAVWNTLHGQPFHFTNRGNDDYGLPTRLSIHVEPIILPLALLYLIHSGPETLLVTQTVALALGAIPLAALSLRRLPEWPLLGAAFAAAYLLSPLLMGEALWDFHPVALATPLLLAAIWAIDARRYGWFLAFAILAMATKEDVGLSVAILALGLAVVRTEKRRYGLLVALGAIIWVVICFKFILPHYNVGIPGGNNYWYRYAQLGATPTQAIINIFTKPWILLGYLFTPGRLYYLGILARTAGGLGLLLPVTLLAATPDLAVNLLSSHAEQYSGFFQYNAAILPYLAAAGVYGAAALIRASQKGKVSKLRDVNAALRAAFTSRNFDTIRQNIGAYWDNLLARIPLPARWLPTIVFVWVLALSLWNVNSVGRVAPFWAAGNPPSPALAARMASLDALLARIPANASVCATDTLNPHVSDRYDLYLAPDVQCYQANYVAMDLPNAIANVRPQDATMLQRMQTSGRYTVIGRVGQVVLLKRVGAPLAP